MSDRTILVIGANGTVGTEVVKHLLAAGQRVRALVRDREKARSLGDVELVIGDASSREALDHAFEGVEKAFTCLPVSPEMPRLDDNTFAAAKRAGTRHIVRVSAGGGGLDLNGFMRDTPYAKYLLHGEEQLRAYGGAWTSLMPGTFASNASRIFGVPQRGVLRLPAGTAEDSHIDPADIGAVAAKVLTTPGHEGKSYALTGPEMLGYAKLIARINAITGRSFVYVDVPPDAWAEEMLAAGAPAFAVESMSRAFGGVREGRMRVTSTVEEVLGRPARTVDDYTRAHAHEFAAPS